MKNYVRKGYPPDPPEAQWCPLMEDYSEIPPISFIVLKIDVPQDNLLILFQLK